MTDLKKTFELQKHKKKCLIHDKPLFFTEKQNSKRE